MRNNESYRFPRRGLHRALVLGVVFLLGGIGNLAAVISAEDSSRADFWKKSFGKVMAEGRVPIVVFDIEGTLVDNRPRTCAILKKFVEEKGNAYPDVAPRIRNLRADSVQYHLVDTFQDCGISNLFVLEHALKFWADRFFSNRFLRFDTAIPGAVAFVNRLWKSGAMIVYLTGRDKPSMFSGTAGELEHLGFPIGVERTMLIMKPKPKAPAAPFKNEAAGFIERLGTVVAAFDDSMRNIEVYRKRWPEARIVQMRRPGQARPPQREGVEVWDGFPRP
ncbi:MAG: HAD family hydrolase [Candidatus Hydrogenedentota bacterium]|nr:MAG: HAD family hydrolase [Candidatus Hydrogenedentota bacterium]